MKDSSNHKHRLGWIAAAGIATTLAQFAGQSAFGATYYWDNNGDTTGFGTAAGTWADPTTGDATQGWSTSSTGVLLPGDVTTTASDALNFGTGTAGNGLDSGTVTVSGSVTSGNITFGSQSGAITVSGGTITLGTDLAGKTITVNNASDTIASDIASDPAAPATLTPNLTKAGNGTLYLSGSNTYVGNTWITAGVLVLNSENALPSGGVTLRGGLLGLGAGDFTRLHGAGAAPNNTSAAPGRFYFYVNGGWAAYGADRIVNVGGAGATQQWFNGKTLILGAADSTHKVTLVNGLTLTTVTRPLRVDDGLAPVDGQLSGVFTENAGALAGINKTGAGTVAITGLSTFTGSVIVNSGTVIVNRLENAGSNSPIGKGVYGVTLAGGTFQYAPIDAVGGEAKTIDRNFAITASSSLDASGTGALVFDAPAGSIISPDVTGLAFTATGADKKLTLSSANPNLTIGMTVTGDGIADGSTITQISGLSITLTSSANVTSTSGTANFGTPTARTLTLTGTNTDANTLAGILQDSSATGAGVLSITKEGIGKWVLSGANTYTGNTTVNEGTLELATSGQLQFVLGATSGVNNSLTGTGTVTLDGAFVIDTLAADALSSGTWTLEDVTTLTGAYGANFSVVGFDDAGGDKWTKTAGGKTYTFDETTGILTLTSAGYASWASLNGASANLNEDHDNDGVDNGIEYFLGGPTGTTTGFTALPGVIDTAGTLSVTWPKGAGYLGVYGTDFVVETSATLSGVWATETLGGGNITDSGTEVKYTFPGPLSGKNFARLKVTGP